MTRRAALGLRAKKDVANAFEWDEAQQPGLGEAFAQAVDSPIHPLRLLPELGHLVYGDLRLLSVRRFPYALYYRVTRSSIRIRACLHERRHARVRETPQVPTRSQLPDAQVARAGQS